MKIKSIIFAVMLLGMVSDVQLLCYVRLPRPKILEIPVYGPPLPRELAALSPIERFEAKLNEFLDYFKAKRECLKNRTCSREVIRNLTTMATMISVLALFAFVRSSTRRSRFS
jgi:hypothetical protein